MEMTAKALHSQIGAALACVDRGETVTITYRGKPRAKLVGMDGPRQTDDEEKMPAFGMWRDRDDVADVDAYVRSRFTPLTDYRIRSHDDIERVYREDRVGGSPVIGDLAMAQSERGTCRHRGHRCTGVAGAPRTAIRRQPLRR